MAQGSLQKDTVVETLQPVHQVLLAPRHLPPQGLLGYGSLPKADTGSSPPSVSVIFQSILVEKKEMLMLPEIALAPPTH